MHGWVAAGSEYFIFWGIHMPIWMATEKPKKDPNVLFHNASKHFLLGQLFTPIILQSKFEN